MWLHLQFTKSVTVNNSIIDAYYTELVRLGLKNKIGFYVTSQELEKITWKNYCDDWLLWLNRHVSSVSDINQLLTPQLFVI